MNKLLKKLPCGLVACALALSLSCSDNEKKTAMMVEVVSDLAIPEQMDQIFVEVLGDNPPPDKRPYQLNGTNAVTLPLLFAVVPSDNTSKGFTVTARGFRNGVEAVHQTAHVKFLSGETRLLTLVLGRDCIGKECSNASLTCSRGRCESIERDPNSLPVFKQGEDRPNLDAGPVDADVGEPDGSPPDMMSCAPNMDQACGRCNEGRILCSGSCSVTVPSPTELACGRCNGVFSCDGTCSAATPPNFGEQCGSCGVRGCDGSCVESKPDNFAQACGTCGKIQCDGTCKESAPASLGQSCGTCGTIQCDGTCKENAPSNLGQSCGSCGTIQCNGTCKENAPSNLGQSCGTCGTVQCNGSCLEAKPADFGQSCSGGCGTIQCNGMCSAATGPTSLVPVLSGNTAAVTQSGEYHSDFPGWQVFDGMPSMWISAEGQTPAWIGYEWSTPRVVSSYALAYTNGSITTRAPKDWQLQGSNGGAWTTVDTRANETNWGASPTRTYVVQNPGSYTKYRLLISDDNDSRTGIVVISLGNLSLNGCK